jgi:hypothetical protein
MKTIITIDNVRKAIKKAAAARDAKACRDFHMVYNYMEKNKMQSISSKELFAFLKTLDE